MSISLSILACVLVFCLIVAFSLWYDAGDYE